MSELGPSELSVIFGFLTLRDIANASLVSRRWCVLLWRKEEQYALWVPRLRAKLLTGRCGKVFYTTMLNRVMQELFLQRQLPYASSTAICENFAHIKRCIEIEQDKLIKRIVAEPDLVRTTLSSKSSDPETLPIYTYVITFSESAYGGPAWFVPSFSSMTECALYTCKKSLRDTDTMSIFCMRGLFDEGRLLAYGDLIIDDHLMYSGEFKLGMPWGQGTMFAHGAVQVRGSFRRGAPEGHATYYMPSGAIRYDGEWAQGSQHGEGTMFHEESPQRCFQGRFEQGQAVEGTWYNDDGALVHVGHGRWFAEQLAASQQRHQCSYSFTKKCHTQQPWWHCKTCYPKSNMGCCQVCAMHCHQGHELIKKEPSPFFCDCGAGDPEGFTCKAIQGCQDTDHCSCKNPSEARRTTATPPEEEAVEEDTDEISDEENEVVPAAAAQENLQQLILQQIALRGGNQRVFLEVDPQDLHVLGMQLVPHNVGGLENEEAQQE